MSAAGSSRARSRMSPGWDWFPEYGACPTCARCPTGSGSGFGPLLDRDVSRRHGWCRQAPADSGGCSRYRWRTSPAVFDHVRVTSGEHHSEPAVTRWTRSTIYPDMWVDPDDDPRETGGQTVGERSTVLDYLRRYRLTLELKCADLDAEQLARRSVPPSSMSLLGMIRHLAEVERHWFRRAMAGQDAPRLYCSDLDRDGDWNGAVPDPEVVHDAWRAWRAGAHDRGVRAALRARRSPARAHRRPRRTVAVQPARPGPERERLCCTQASIVSGCRRLYTVTSARGITGGCDHCAYTRIASLTLFVAALVGASVGAVAPAAVAASDPLPPTGLTATAVSSTEVALTWNPVSGATGYEVWWGDRYYSEYLATTTQTTFRHTSLGPGGTYGYAVRTVTRKALSPLSAFVEVTTPPEAPTLLQAEVIKADQVRLSWQPGRGALTYAITEVAADGTERPSTVLEMQERTAVVQTVAETEYTFRIRGVNGALQSLDYGTVGITTPPREPSVINHDSPSPVPAGETVLTFSIVGTQTLQPTYGTLGVSIDGGPVATATVDQKTATLAATLAPGTHSMSADYSGDGAFLPSHADFTFFDAVAAPTFAVEAIDSSDVSAAAAADVTCDGIADLVSASRALDGSGASLDVRPGRQDGTLGPVRSTALPWPAGSLAAGDLNRDGCADVAVLGTDLLTFTGAPAGLAQGSRIRASGLMSNVSVHDMTHDGLLDAVVNHTDGVVMLPGNGRGGFGRSRTIG